MSEEEVEVIVVNTLGGIFAAFNEEWGKTHGADKPSFEDFLVWWEDAEAVEVWEEPELDGPGIVAE